MTKKKLKKVLIIRFSSIGDIVLTTPVVRCVQQQLGVEVHYLTKSSFRSLLEDNPYVDSIFTIEKKVSEVLHQLKQQNYDAIVDLHKNLRSQRIRWGLPVPYFTFDKINWEKWLMVNFKVNRLPAVHIVHRYMKAVAPLGVVYDGEGLEPLIFEPTADQSCAYSAAGKIVFAVGGAHATKRLPTEKIIAICQGIKFPILLIGGKEDATIGEKIVLFLQRKDVINLCGKTNLKESALLIRQAQKVITHDTGMMHIAAAFQKQIISIWGNTIPEFGMYPFYKKGVKNNVSFQVKNLPCRPCSKIGFKACPKGHFRCMEEMDIQSIIACANQQ
ncbi:MAG: glycosyltransferase family 9 protein [Bacteroidota bacterium]